MPHEISHDAENRRFALETSVGEAYLVYRMKGPQTMDATSTYTPPAARGEGAAGRLVEAALDHARAQGWRVVPSCWYVDGWISRHPAYEDLRA
ncbi:MAG: GNAT family N-acetyltransferase [Planctomycetota bacterium]|nr:GNAT family N-acetyltransferase [Planctomycetota bacterium]